MPLAKFNTLPLYHEFKKPEIILTYPQPLFENRPEGFIRTDEGSPIPFKENEIWLSRDHANANTDTLRQASSYVVLVNSLGESNCTVAVYSRGAGADAKLSGKLSVGYGGHPELVDIDGEFSSADIILNSAMREVGEEVKFVDFDGCILQLEEEDLIEHGIILDNSDAIGSYHVGFLFTTEIHTDVGVTDVNRKVERFIGWHTAEELQKLADEGRFENWSVIALRDALKLIK